MDRPYNSELLPVSVLARLDEGLPSLSDTLGDVAISLGTDLNSKKREEA